MNLEHGGDSEEQEFYSKLIKPEFPEYEQFWDLAICPITLRPKSIDLKSSAELEAMGKTDNDWAIALLHIRLLTHLIRVYKIKKESTIDKDLLIEAVIRLAAGLDVAEELLERRNNPQKYDPYEENGKDSGYTARKTWRTEKTKERHQIDELLKYRNALIHGRSRPFLPTDRYVCIGKEKEYVDNRRVAHNDHIKPFDERDFIPMRDIVDDAWDRTIKYLREMWKKYLLPTSL